MSRMLTILLLGTLLAACGGSSPVPVEQVQDQEPLPLVTVYKPPT